MVDVGGTHGKVLVTGLDESRKFSSGPKMTAAATVSGVKANAFLGGLSPVGKKPWPRRSLR